MFNLHIADIISLAVYLLGVTALGMWAARRVKTAGDFIMPRKFGKAMMMMHSFGTATHSDQAVSVASKSASVGLAGIWYQWMWLFATPFFWVIAPMMRRLRALTTGDVFAARFDRGVAGMYAVLGLVKFMVNIALMLKGASVIIDAASDGALPAGPMILVMTGLFVVYGLAGGLSAAIVTDFVQGILTIVFSFLLLPACLSAVGGLPGMKETLGAEMFSLVAPGDVSVFYIFMIALNALLGVAVQPHNMGVCGAGRGETDGAVGFMGGMFLKRICTIAWALTALAAVAYFGSIDEPDKVYGQMAREFLPGILPGLLGLFLAALLATVMGSCDSFMVASSGLITQNLYKPFVSDKSDAHYLWVARISGLIVVIGGVIIAFNSDSVVKLLEQLWKINVMTAAAFWLGIFWRRTTVVGAWAATIAMLSVWAVTTLPTVASWLNGFAIFAENGITRLNGKGVMTVWTPWQMLFYIVAGFGVGIIASLLTKPVSSAKLERFYQLLRTPVTPGETVNESCTLPDGAEPGPRRVFFANSSFELPIPSKRDLIGFGVGWVLVFAIIAFVVIWIAE
ncbi:MAG: Na+/proline symporter [Verrucomicrobiales bacterium]|jgi:Na+/proline symporter